MSILRASFALREGIRSLPRRNLAIMPTVKVASDTSEMDFPAPSHVSLSSDAADMSRQLREFYSNPDSAIFLSEDERKSLHAEIVKKLKTIPDSQLDDNWADVNVPVPEKIRLGDNPYFDAYKKDRDERKLH